MFKFDPQQIGNAHEANYLNEIETQTHKHVKEILVEIVGKCSIEFLTKNLFGFVKMEIQNRRSNSAKEIRLRDTMLNEPVVEEITRRASDIYEPELKRTQNMILTECEKIFYRYFSHPDKARRKFNEPTNDIVNVAQKLETDNSGSYSTDLNTRDSSLLRDGSSLNKMIKSTTGVLSSLILTYFIYLYLRYQVKAEALSTTWTLCVAFTILIVGLTSNWPKFRCIVLLSLPYMASSRGRAIMLMNCVSLTTTIVAPNILANLEQIQLSFICNKEMVDNFLTEWSRENDAAIWLRDNIDRIRSISQNVVKKLDATKKLLRNSSKLVTTAYRSLKNVSKFNMQAFSGFNKICDKILSDHPIGKFLQWTNLAKCDIKPDFNIFIDERLFFSSLMSTLKNKTIDQLDNHIDDIIDPLIKQFQFNASVDFNSSLNHANQANYRQIILKLAAIYQERLEFLNVNIFPKINLILPFSLLIVLYSSIRYHRKYLKYDFYQNNVMGVKFYEIDHKRRLNGEPSLLPLKSTIRAKYVGLFEIRMTTKEKAYTLKSISRLLMAMTPLIIALWLDTKLASINAYLASSTGFEMEWGSNGTAEGVRGNGFVADAFRQMFDLNQNTRKKINNYNCLPQTRQIDPSVHRTIGVYAVLLFCLGCLQAYIKRMRAFLCGCVYPDRDLERSIWLYNHLSVIYTSLNLWRGEKKDPKLTRFQILSKLIFITLFPVVSISTVIELIRYKYRNSVEKLSFGNLVKRIKLKFLPILLTLNPPKSNIRVCSDCHEIVVTDAILECGSCDAIYCRECVSTSCKICGNRNEGDTSSSDELNYSTDSSWSHLSDQQHDKPHQMYGSLIEVPSFSRLDFGNLFGLLGSSRCQHYLIRPSAPRIIPFEKEQAILVINKSFSALYTNLAPLMGLKSEFIHVVKYSSCLRQLFEQEMDVYRDIGALIVKNFISNELEAGFSNESKLANEAKNVSL